MYTDFFRLKEKPFRLLPDPDFFYPGAKHRAALSHLEYGIIEQAGFVVITGEVGCGKTTLLKLLLRKLDARIKVGVIFNTNVPPEEFLKLVAHELELNCAQMGQAQVLSTINSFLINEFTCRRKVILIVDEAQNLSTATLEELRMLSNLQTEKAHLLQIILVGQPSLQEKLRARGMEQLAQRVVVHYHLRPLDANETRAYIGHRLSVAGRRDVANIFSPGALDLIFLRSKGIPRLINLMCDAALLCAFAEGQERIDETTIEEVCRDRDLALAAGSTVSPAGKTSGGMDSARVAEIKILAGRLEKVARAASQDRQRLAAVENKLAQERHYLLQLRAVLQEQDEEIKVLQHDARPMVEDRPAPVAEPAEAEPERLPVMKLLLRKLGFTH
ncbi:MAG: AAA family ATPase [Pseudomonadota bacterium]